MTRRLLPIFLALAVFILALLMMRPAPEIQVVVAARALPAGHTLTDADLALLTFPGAVVPEDAYQSRAALLGETLRQPRSRGDLVRPEHLGGEVLELAWDERAIAIQVTDSAGLSGLLRPGDRVGVTAVLLTTQGTFAKVVAENLRVLYLSPDFEALDPAVLQPQNDEGGISSSQNVRREKTGVVVLAVPTAAQAVAYNFSHTDSPSESRSVFVIDLLPALDHARDVQLSLFLEPAEALRISTAGVFLPDLMLTPGPTPTPGPVGP